MAAATKVCVVTVVRVVTIGGKGVAGLVSAGAVATLMGNLSRRTWMGKAKLSPICPHRASHPLQLALCPHRSSHSLQLDRVCNVSLPQSDQPLQAAG